MDRYEAGLARVNEAFDSTSEYKREVSELAPQLQQALAIVQEHVDFVEVQREEYIKVSPPHSHANSQLLHTNRLYLTY